ncbi:RelA/SpoT domain-containing protein [Clostridium perfringens]|uniref:RelA/SpoT domain-containing protein n=2 Tax=Clostridium perfringens TaxID=1502 RepID=UPI00016BCBEB|nr:RelA/SpoT domain-containing protein [Clostridium perfringens]EDT27087.1 GTP pyrophosphokinase homolog [Clostridium perfringens CPE str. F4969]EGT0679886.1 RelA/SpoT domain-containing protein [Clostridium perfringens]EHR1327408.1 RelA/SpoT domain-containing protein [Clostridium perfringens]EHR1330541.1 RelA/SpoT domain-containing protein [Clostridium perfringens]EHR1424018.1 RelA/SpoT domain-containing protein [Clostridium perfringens]
MRSLNKEVFLKKYPHVEEYIEKNKIEFEDLQRIYKDFVKFEGSYYNQADFIANILRSNENVHSVKSRIKNPDRLIEKIIRKTEDRKEKYGEDFYFNEDNYKNEITDLIGIRVLHIFKDQWKDIHDFIIKTWNVIEITANIRDGDDRSIFDNLGIEVISRQSGYRSVHYLVELNFTQDSTTIAEIQVRTIFEEGYGEIDHRLRYSHQEIPEILKSNLLLFNRIVGSADEMASLINMLNNNLDDKDNYYETKLKEKDEEIRKLKEEIEKLK